MIVMLWSLAATAEDTAISGVARPSVEELAMPQEKPADRRARATREKRCA